MSEAIGCHSCGDKDIIEIPEFRSLARVSSDCRGRNAGGRLAVCRGCGLVQAVIDEAWREEIDEIYRTYDIYFQSGGIEQAVFDSGSGAASPRSTRLVESLAEELDLGGNGRMLDAGCGNGAFLRAFSQVRPTWDLFGSEISDKYQKDVEAIQGVRKFFPGGIAEIDEQFDLVSLIHVLEHIESPVAFLSTIRSLLAPGGSVFIEVPFFVDNPFDLIIADHASHFTPASLSAVAARCGFEVQVLSTDWVRKEISCLLSTADAKTEKANAADGESAAGSLGEAESRVAWLQRCRETLQRPAEASNFGIFGTSIGANWLHEELKARGADVDFFVDEDPSRIGRKLLGRPILAPRDLPAGSVVAVPLAPVAASAVTGRLRSEAKEAAVLIPGDGNVAAG